MSDNRDAPMFGGGKDARQAEFGNAEDSQRKDTQNTLGDSGFGDGEDGQAEGGGSADDDEGEDTSGDEGEEDVDAVIPGAETVKDTSFARQRD